MNGFMFDTTVFNHLLRDGVALVTLKKPIFVTHIQHDELGSTKDIHKREALLAVFREVQPESVPTESAVWNVSRWNQARWSRADGLWQQILAALSAANRSKGNNKQDTLIAETAIRNSYILVTDDGDLGNVTRQFGGLSISLREYLSDAT